MSLTVLHVIYGTYSLHKGTSRRSTLSKRRRVSCFSSFRCCPVSPSNREWHALCCSWSCSLPER